MDLRSYYRKLYDVQSTIHAEYVVVSSLSTAEGGRAGVLTEVPKALAARLIAEGRAELATVEQTAAFHENARAAKEEAEAIADAAKLRVVVMPSETRRPRKNAE